MACCERLLASEHQRTSLVVVMELVGVHHRCYQPKIPSSECILRRIAAEFPCKLLSCRFASVAASLRRVTTFADASESSCSVSGYSFSIACAAFTITSARSGKPEPCQHALQVLRDGSTAELLVGLHRRKRVQRAELTCLFFLPGSL